MIGIIVADCCTIVILAAAQVFGHGETQAAWMILLPWFIVIAPAFVVSHALGLEWRVGSVYEIPFPTFVLMLVTNACVGAFLGFTLGWLGSFLWRTIDSWAERRG